MDSAGAYSRTILLKSYTKYGGGDSSPGYRRGSSCQVIIALSLFLCLLILPRTASSFCFEEAGAAYKINPALLWAIAKVESNFNPLAVNWNSNGTYDFGLMQINSGWYKVLGDELWRNLSDPCVNVYTGAWVLAQCVQKYGYTWEAVGCYNAKTKFRKSKYAMRVYAALKSNRQKVIYVLKK